MKKILMFFIPDELPVLKEIEGKGIVFQKDLNEEHKNYIMRYYNKLGCDFDQRFNNIKAYENKNNKLPIFIENPKIKFIVEEKPPN